MLWVVIVDMLRMSMRIRSGKPVLPLSESKYIRTQLDPRAWFHRCSTPEATMIGAELKQVWQYLRQVTGDDAYERYLLTTGRRTRASRR